ncbi:hypothetical protein H2203_005374 [Taxawa tesnikishii (nom. ined.)]|nr:hypothetical protein H2203_005374 [Dothideales sp. JES 119]
MSLKVKHLNGDTTFLLTFTPAIAPANSAQRFPGDFIILVDPWLKGPSSVWTPKFQISHHTRPSAITSLKDLPEPDLILISQDKPDHCHRETLCSLPPSSQIPILATAAAAKKIRSWNHFENPDIVSALREYRDKNESGTIYRRPLPPYSSSSAPGEITVSYMPQRMDMTRLHNALGITYRPPSTVTKAVTGQIVNLPLSPPVSPPIHRPMTADSNTRPQSLTRNRSIASIASRPDTPTSIGYFHATPAEHRERTLSVLYSPHGVSTATVAPYTSFLARENALPLTALFHSINTEQNPWFMGGRVAAGYPGGLDLLRKVGAHYWISAHDEDKDNRGFATVMINSGRYKVEEVQRLVEQEFLGSCDGLSAGRKRDSAHSVKEMGRVPIVVDIDVGEEMRIDG